MGVLDAMGRGCVPVKIGGDSASQPDRIPFDRAAYRYFTVPDGDTEAAKSRLQGPIEKALLAWERGDQHANPSPTTSAFL